MAQPVAYKFLCGHVAAVHQPPTPNPEINQRILRVRDCLTCKALGAHTPAERYVVASRWWNRKDGMPRLIGPPELLGTADVVRHNVHLEMLVANDRAARATTLSDIPAIWDEVDAWFEYMFENPAHNNSAHWSVVGTVRREHKTKLFESLYRGEAVTDPIHWVRELMAWYSCAWCEAAYRVSTWRAKLSNENPP